MRRRTKRYLIALIAVLAAWGVGATLVYRVGSSNRAADRRAVQAYEDAIVDAARRAGAVVELQMKPSVAEAREGTISGQELQSRAQSWRTVFVAARRDFLAATPPPALAGIEGAWERAFDAYLEAIRLFEEAGAAPAGAQRTRLLDQGIDAAERADDLFDRGSARLQRVRRLLDMGPTTRFPDPEAT